MPVSLQQYTHSEQGGKIDTAQNQITTFTWSVPPTYQQHACLDTDPSSRSSSPQREPTSRLSSLLHSNSNLVSSGRVQLTKQKLREASLSSDQERSSQQLLKACGHSLETLRRTSVDQLIDKFEKQYEPHPSNSLQILRVLSVLPSSHCQDSGTLINLRQPPKNTRPYSALLSPGSVVNDLSKDSGSIESLQLQRDFVIKPWESGMPPPNSSESFETATGSTSQSRDFAEQMVEEQRDRRTSTVPELSDPERKLQLKSLQQRQNRWNKFGLFKPSLTISQSSDIAAQAHVDVPPHQQSPALESLIRFDIGHPESCNANVQSSDPEHTQPTERSQEPLSEAPPGSDSKTPALQTAKEGSEESTTATERQESTVGLESAPDADVEAKLEPEPEPEAENGVQSTNATEPISEAILGEDQPGEAPSRLNYLVPVIHIQAPTPVVDPNMTATRDGSEMATSTPILPMASPTTFDLDSLRAMSNSEEDLPSQNALQPLSAILGTDPLVDTNLVPTLLPVNDLPALKLPQVTMPDLPSSKPSRRRRFVKRARKLLLRKTILVLLLGHELGDATHDQVKQSRVITKTASIPSLDGMVPMSKMDYDYIKHPVYRENPRLTSPVLRAHGARITWESSAPHSARSTPRMRPQQAARPQQTVRGQSYIHAQQSLCPEQSTQTRSSGEQQQHIQMQQPLRPQQGSPFNTPKPVPSRQERKLAREKLKQQKRDLKRRNKEAKRKQRQAKRDEKAAQRQQGYRKQAEELRISINQDVEKHEQEVEKLPKCEICGKKPPSLQLTRYLSSRKRASLIDSILEKEQIPKKVPKALLANHKPYSAAEMEAMRQQYECNCPGREKVQPAP